MGLADDFITDHLGQELAKTPRSDPNAMTKLAKSFSDNWPQHLIQIVILTIALTGAWGTLKTDISAAKSAAESATTKLTAVSRSVAELRLEMAQDELESIKLDHANEASLKHYVDGQIDRTSTRLSQRITRIEAQLQK